MGHQMRIGGRSAPAEVDVVPLSKRLRIEGRGGPLRAGPVVDANAAEVASHAGLQR